MKVRTSNKLSFAISIFLLAGSQATPVLAADNTGSNQAAPAMTNPSNQNYPTPPPGGWEGATDSIDQQNKNAAPQQQGSTQSTAQQRGAIQPQQYRSSRGGYGTPGYGAPRYNQRPYGGRRDYDRGGRSSPWGGSSGPSFSGPWDSGRGGSKMPWDSGRGGRSMPWDSGRGGSSMPWGSKSKKGRGGWMDKDRFADSWDDMLNAPSDMGELPGGFYAPSVSVPNPVDVGDEFDDAARDVPGQMRNVYDDNRRNNTYDRYDSYDRYDRGRYDRYRR